MKHAFTLSEVLITLGVIGVVSAMTLPALVQNYRNHVAETRLKKFYSMFNQAIQRSVVENGDFENWDYFMSNDSVDDEGNLLSISDKVDANFQKYLAPYMKIVDKKIITDASGYETIIYYLPDGSAFSYMAYENREINYYLSNPEKCAKLTLNEQRGTCMFRFQFYPINNSAQWKYLYKKGLEAYLHDWDGNKESLKEGKTHSCSQGGNYCTALIQQNGWKIPKDYPRKIKF